MKISEMELGDILELKGQIEVELGKRLGSSPCSAWVRCKYADAEQHRSRVLTGSIGLEGPWSDWKDGKPARVAMNRQYEYRKQNDQI